MLIDAKEILDSSLKLPYYLLKEYFQKRQIESTFNFNTFATCLFSKILEYKERIKTLREPREKRPFGENEAYKINDKVIKQLLHTIGISETYKPGETLVIIDGHNDLDELNRKLDKIISALWSNRTLYQKSLPLTSIQIFGIVEDCLKLIAREYKDQLIKKPKLGERVDSRYESSRAKKGEQIEINYYRVLDDHILFNFPLLKRHVAETLLNSTNPSELKNVLQNIYNTSRFNFEVWNNNYSFLGGDAEFRKNILFDEEKFSVKFYPSNYLLELEIGQTGKSFSNYDFALFSNNVHNFLNSTLFGNSSVKTSSASKTPTTRLEKRTLKDIWLGDYDLLISDLKKTPVGDDLKPIITENIDVFTWNVDLIYMGEFIYLSKKKGLIPDHDNAKKYPHTKLEIFLQNTFKSHHKIAGSKKIRNGDSRLRKEFKFLDKHAVMKEAPENW